MAIYSSIKVISEKFLILSFVVFAGSVSAADEGAIKYNRPEDINSVNDAKGFGLSGDLTKFSANNAFTQNTKYKIDQGLLDSYRAAATGVDNLGCNEMPYSLGTLSLFVLQKDWREAACSGVTRDSSCDAVSACVNNTAYDMGSIFANSEANKILANDYMDEKLSTLYPELLSFDAMALYAKDKYEIQYPDDYRKEARNNCYYGFELATNSDWCKDKDFTKNQIGKIINSCISNPNSSCSKDLPETQKLSLNNFSEKKGNKTTNSFEMDYLYDQRDQLAKHFSDSEGKLNEELFALFSSSNFQKKSIDNKLKDIQKHAKNDAVLNYLFVSESTKRSSNKVFDGLKLNGKLVSFLSTKPSTADDFRLKFESFKISEIKEKLQMENFKNGKCEFKENVTTICAKGKSIGEGRVLTEDKFFKFKVDDKSRDFLALINALKIDKDAKEDLAEYGILFLKAKHCLATGQTKEEELTTKNKTSIADNVGDIYNSSAVNSKNSISSWGVEEYNSSSMDFSKMGQDSEFGAGNGGQKANNESLAEFAKNYSNDQKPASDFAANAISFPNQPVPSTYIPKGIRNQDAKNNGTHNSDNGQMASGQSEVVAGVGRSTASISAGSEDLKLAKDQLAKSQQEIQNLKLQMEKDKFQGLENELIKKQSKLDQLNAKIANLEKNQATSPVAKVEKAARVTTTTSPSIGSFGVSASSASKVESAPAKFDSKSVASSAPASSARSNDAGRAPTAILSSSSSESRSSGSGNNQVIKVDGMSNKDVTESIKKKITELKGGSFFIEENGVIKEIIVETKDGKIVLDENGNPVYKEVEVGKGSEKMLALQSDNTKGPKVKTTADLKKLDENAVKSNNNRGAFYQNLIKETKKVIKTETRK